MNEKICFFLFFLNSYDFFLLNEEESDSFIDYSSSFHSFKNKNIYLFFSIKNSKIFSIDYNCMDKFANKQTKKLNYRVSK